MYNNYIYKLTCKKTYYGKSKKEVLKINTVIFHPQDVNFHHKEARLTGTVLVIWLLFTLPLIMWGEESEDAIHNEYHVALIF